MPFVPLGNFDQAITPSGIQEKLSETSGQGLIAGAAYMWKWICDMVFPKILRQGSSCSKSAPSKPVRSNNPPMKLPLLIFLSFAFCVAAVSQDPSGPVSLFDGKSLEAWDYDPAIWRIEDGLMTGGSTTEKIKANYFIATKKSYQNFELKLSIKCSGDPKTGLINSGIQIRSVRVPGGNHMAGYQVDCGDTWFGKIYDEYRRRTVIVEQVDAAALTKVVDVFGWNDYRIRAEGPRIRVWINDVLATDFTETNPKIALNGQIAPQVHSGGVALVQVKDITVEELPPTPGAPTWESLGGLEAALKATPPAPRKKKKKEAPAKSKAGADKVLSPSKGEGFVSFDFESGDLQGWFISEGWFAHPVANNDRVRAGGFRSNKEGKFYLGTLEVMEGGSPSDQQVGILESPVFKLSGPEITFAVSGGKHTDTTYVALCTLDGKEVKKAYAENSEIFSNRKWTVPELVGKPVFVRLVDQTDAGWGHITLDAFSAKGTILPDESKARLALAKPSPEAKRKPKPKARVAKKTQSARVEAWSPEKELAGFTVPDGFVIELVASEEHGVINPIDISFDDAGRLWTQTGQMYPLDPISGMKWQEFLALMEDQKTQENNPEFKRIGDLYKLETKGEDKILILDDPTKPAKGPMHVWADGLSIPQSVLPYKDGAYVCHGSELFFLRDTDGDGKSDKMEPVLSGFGYTDTHTMSHLLVRGPGSYIHFSQGALNKALVTAVESGKQHRVDASCQVRFGLDHQDFEVISSGPSNMWGLQLRANGEWYGTEANDRSYSVMPWEHGTGVTGAAYHPLRPYQPLLPNLHDFRVGGTGISGLEFSEDTEGSFPVDEWKDVALLANCITSTINAVRVHRNPDGTVEAEHLPDFLTATDDWFRPVNLEFGPDGCLYVADFYNKIISHNEVTTDHPDRDRGHGRIWRIRHESQKPREIPDVTKASPKQLLGHLQSPTLWEKRAAWHQIGDRGLVELAPALVELAGDETIDAVSRIHALWSLEELTHFDSDLVNSLLKSKNDEIRREVVRSLASFDVEPAEVAARLVRFIDDENVMVRSQVIRTLSDLKKSDPAVIALLIHACKPAIPGNQLGGSYERSFERFLARMALEKFPAELKSYLEVSSENHPAENVLWAIQALDEGSKREAFLGLWSKVSGETLDRETFVAITGMLGNKEVYDAVAPTFQDPSKAENLVLLALSNQSRVQSKALIKMLTPSVSKLLKSPETTALGLNAIGKLRIATLADEVAAVQPKGGDTEMQRLLFTAKTVNPTRNAGSFKAIADDNTASFDLRIEAAHALAPIDKEEAYRLAKGLIDSGDAAQKGQIASVFSQSKEGSALLCGFYKNKAITADVFDLSSAERVIGANPGSPFAKEIFASVQGRIAQQRKEAQKRIHELMAYIGKNPGDPEKGKMVFGSCLACHKVGDEGQEIGPPLDGSGHRELEHLLTAIVDPDAAVEGGYGLYRVTKTDGSVVEGLLDKTEALGTTVAMMGGARIFVPQAEIKKSGFVGGRSFMLAAFGQLPEETMADLVAYVGTLKEGGPSPSPRKAAPSTAPAQAAAKPADQPLSAKASKDRPNIILIFTDDQGYEDLGCFGSKTIKTPNIDQMAAEGLRLTNFYAQPVCGVSRAALMTGSYPIRVGEPRNIKQLHTVPHPEEITMAEVLKSAGYATGIIGKWHLTNKGNGPGGFEPATMPNAQGFDYFYGTPVFNGYTVFVEDTALRVPIFRNQEVVVEGVENWDNITADYTKEAINYIEQNKEEPFFLYLAHNMPHIPVGASEDFKGKSDYGPYGDTIEEIDWSTGQILDKLKELGIDDNTIVIYTSDNGPWVETTKGMKPDGAPFIPRDHSGSAAPLRGWKMSAWDGGCKVPFIARWPKKIAASGVSDEILSTMDLLPTFARLAGAKLPTDRTLDGSDATSFLLGESKESPRDDYFYYSGSLLTGVRVDQWKLVLPRPETPQGTGWWGRMIEEVKEVHLFDLDTDPGETTNLADKHPDVVAALQKRIEVARAELGDLKVVGTGARFFDEGPRRIPGLSAADGKKKADQPAASYDKFEPVGNLRFSFEGGDLEGWEMIDGKLGEAVTSQKSLANLKGLFARHGDHHLSTLMVGKDKVSDKQVGVLQSPAFTLEGGKAAFLMSGGFDEELLYVGLVDAKSGEVLVHSGGKRDHHLRRIIWDVAPWKGRNVRFQVVDRAPSGWGHLNVDDFSVKGTLVAATASKPEQAAMPIKKGQTETPPPNVIFIFADDLGYGDLGCYGATKVKTPNIDGLARDGRKFTDAHSASAVCTPSRYALITGEYPIRAHEGKGVWGPLPSTSGLIIDTDTPTIGKAFQAQGYETAAIGKWHLGFGEEKNDWSVPLKPGPNEVGFDYYFGVPLVNSGSPYVYVENDTIVGHDPADPLVLGKKPISPTPTFPIEASRKSPNRFGGALKAHEIYDDEKTGELLTKKATDWITGNKEKPFFLYFPTTHIHHPFTPAPRFKGTSGAGLYGDYVHELDWMVGELLSCLEQNGLSENTLVIFTSDNGGMLNYGGRIAMEAGHKMNGDLLGFKFGAWEGGHRIPFIARWPGEIEAGSESDQLICNVDMLATFMELLGQDSAALQNKDSVNVLPALLGNPRKPLRNELLLAPKASTNLAIRQGKWMYIGARGSGGFSGGKPTDHAWGGLPAIEFAGSKNSDVEGREYKADAPNAQLYDLETDPSQTTNVIRENPEVAGKLKNIVDGYRSKIPKNPAKGKKKGTGAEKAKQKPTSKPQAAKTKPVLIDGKKPPYAKASASAKASADMSEGRPNFVIIFTDDQGYGDLSCFGGEHVSTPRIDQMAAEGSRLTSFYVAAPVCTPSRAALMTGSYPKRVNMATGSNFGVLLAGDTKGLNPDEITIAEVLKGAGYKTGMFGKWHLGDQPEFLPTRQGFDEYFGIPFSHDIHPFHPGQKKFQFPRLALIEGEEVIEMDPDADYLTKRFTERAVEFIEKNKNEPFFLYVPHPIPHKPLHVSPPFMKDVDPEILEALKNEGEETIDYKTRDRLFHQAIAEVDWSVGQILDTLKAQGLDENTLVIFTSDNGPAIGSAGGLKGRKGSTNEGGMREPTVIRWPGKIPAGKPNDELMTTMDLLPTFAALAGAEVPSDRVIDGKDIWPVLTGERETPHESFFYHKGEQLMAVRSGKWKLHASKGKATELYDLQADIGETSNVIKRNPTVVTRLSKYMADFAKDIAENNRPAAFVENPKPLSK